MPQRRNNRRRKAKPGPIKDVGRAVGKVVDPLLKIPGMVTSAFGPQFSKQLASTMVKAAVPAIAGMVSSGIGAIVSRKALPAAYATSTKNSGARQRTDRNGNSTVTHMEYLGEIGVRTPNLFDLQYQYGINPGNQALFPWLSQIAARFETYRFTKLRFVYVETCGTTTAGNVMMASDSDASDPPPVSAQQMMAYKGAIQTPPYSGAVYAITGGDLHRLKTNYILTGVPPPNTDIKTYDIGNFFLAVNAPAATGSLGRLYVEYTVQLFTPQVLNDAPSVSFSNAFTVPGSGGTTDVINDPDIAGNIPLYFIEQTSTPGTYDVYLPITGTYTLTFYVGCTGSTTYTYDITPMQGDTDLFKVWSPQADTSNQIFEIMQFETTQGDVPALTIACTAQTGAGNPQMAGTMYATILPTSSSIVVKEFAAGTEPVHPTASSDPRNRFGRRPVGNVF